MTVSATTSSSSDVTVTSTPATGSAATDAATTSDRFLKLLVAQMQNQDPLNPMDNAQVTSQMAQINTVSGIEQLNTTMQAMSTQLMQQQAVQGASLVGHSVVVPGNSLAVDATTGDVQGGFQLAGAADTVKVDILSPAGIVLQSLNLGAESAGVHSFDWPPGSNATDGLTFRVSATSGGVATTATALMRDKVEAVRSSGTSFMLDLQQSGSVPYSSVVEID